jgi:NADH dehydrogenase
VDVALCSLTDVRGVRAALAGAEGVIHLAGGEWRHGPTVSDEHLSATETLARAAMETGVRRLVLISHLGVGLTSAYPAFRTKARAEELVRRSGVTHTILRSGVLFGPQDHFTTSIAMLLSAVPLAFPLPSGGEVLLQPLWVEDLVTAIVWSLDDQAELMGTHSVGGPEFLSFRQIVEMIMGVTGRRRLLFAVRPPYLRVIAAMAQRLLPDPPVNPFWLDYLAENRTADLQTLPHRFSLQPSRMLDRLGYLTGRNWLAEAFRRQATRARRRV